MITLILRPQAERLNREGLIPSLQCHPFCRSGERPKTHPELCSFPRLSDQPNSKTCQAISEMHDIICLFHRTFSFKYLWEMRKTASSKGRGVGGRRAREGERERDKNPWKEHKQTQPTPKSAAKDGGRRF